MPSTPTSASEPTTHKETIMQANHLVVVPQTPSESLQAVRQSLKQRFFERENVIDALLASLLAKSHVLLLGPPGTAKSALITALVGSVDGAIPFSWLLTKFSTPEELYGPISLAALQQDRFRRITTDKMPQAHVAFVDEIFKASSAILNTLLTIASDRVFHNDGVVPCPLITLVGASNEMPEGKELEALFDRFLYRTWVEYLGDRDNVRALLTKTAVATTWTISLENLALCQEQAEHIDIADDVIELLLDLKQKLEDQGFRISDRRLKALLPFLRAWAYVNQETQVTADHLADVLPDCLWREPKDRTALVGIISAIANPMSAKALELLDAAKAATKGLGAPNKNDANEKASWVMNASLVTSQLEQMLKELDALASKDKTSKSASARKTVAALQKETASKVAALYHL